MSCPSPANFKTCDPKCRCPSGPCTGIAFSCESPCSGGEIWDPSTCSCLSGGGTYKIQINRSGQFNSAMNGTTCYVSYFPEPYFDAQGRFLERRWFFTRFQQDLGVAYVSINPNGPMQGIPLSLGGPPSQFLPLPSDGVSTSAIVIDAEYCSSGQEGAGTGNGLVSWRTVVDNSYILNGAAVPGASNFAGCDAGRSGVVSTTVTYLGPGRPEEYYESNEISGTGSYKAIVDGETGQPSCQGPTKTL